LVCDEQELQSLDAVEEELSYVFDRLEKERVEIVFARSWCEVADQKDIDVVYILGHTDTRTSDGDYALQLGGELRSSRSFARLLRGRDGEEPEFVFVNGYHPFLTPSF